MAPRSTGMFRAIRRQRMATALTFHASVDGRGNAQRLLSRWNAMTVCTLLEKTMWWRRGATPAQEN